jgi:hypothetical protein
MHLSRGLTLSVLFLAASLGSASAEPTDIVVRVMAKDAKFIGTAVGGAEISLRDADTGEVLAEGVTEGGTGDTPKIMTTPRSSRENISTPEAASFATTLELDRPRRITVTAVGPVVPEGAAVAASSTQWVVPGKHITGGDAWVVELRGFSVSLVEPPPSEVKLDGTGRIALEAKVTMLCGCPIDSGGMWDADKIEVAATVQKDGTQVGLVPLSFAGEVNIFEGEIEFDEPGEYTIDLYAYDPSNGNTGVTQFTVRAL